MLNYISVPLALIGLAISLGLLAAGALLCVDTVLRGPLVRKPLFLLRDAAVLLLAVFWSLFLALAAGGLTFTQPTALALRWVLAVLSVPALLLALLEHDWTLLLPGLFPLLKREIVLPSIYLLKPELGLQEEPDGRRTWALGGDTKDESNVPYIGGLVIEDGTIHYLASARGADITAHLALDRRTVNGAANDMPLAFKAEGRWANQAFSANGRTGDVLYLSAPLQKPFPAEVQARTGNTQLQASGSIASLASSGKK